MANELATSKDITNYLKHVFDLEKCYTNRMRF